VTKPEQSLRAKQLNSNIVGMPLRVITSAKRSSWLQRLSFCRRPKATLSNTRCNRRVLNEYLKAGLGRWMLPVPDIVKSDPFWLKEDPRRAVYVQETLLGPTMPFCEVYNPANARRARHCALLNWPAWCRPLL
jgi:hypothetical protein